MPNVFGTDNSETINASDGVTNGADTIFGFAGNDTIFSLGGNDEIKGGGGADAINGGSGRDTANYSDSNEGVTVSLVSEQGFGGTAEGDTLDSIENLTGSTYGDLLVGNDGANVLTGLEGNDTLKGGGGADILYGDSNNDTLKGGGGGDALNGGSGIDTASYFDSAAGVIVSLITDTASGGDAEGDDLNSIENLTGSAHVDTLLGDDGVNLLKGNDGDDTLKGFGGADTLFGGDGNDSLDGSVGADTMIGGLGNDTYFVDNAGDVVTESIGQGTDQVETSTTYSLALGSAVEVLKTTDANGTTSINLVGNAFANAVIGNDGQNVIVGGLGLDTLTGNNGGDTFVWTASAETGPDALTADIITDFNRPEGDIIAVNPIDADGDPLNGDQAFTFVGTAPFTAAGQISYYNTITDTFIQFNIDADEAPEMMIKISGLYTPDASWFVL